MKKYTFFALAITIALGFYACNDGLNLDGPNEAPPTVQPTNVEFPTTDEVFVASITGQVTDKDGQAVANAVVTCVSCVENQVVDTEADGSFSFSAVDNKGQQAYLSITYPGAFVAFRRLALVEGQQNYTRVQLRDRTMMGQINSAEGGTVSLNNGAQLSLPENGIIDRNGNSYQGDYEVYMAWIDPTDENLNETMMGDLSGIDTEGNLMGLSTFGMLQIELADESGAPLNLAGASEAELQFPVPAELKSIAPAVIPLWSYNEDFGYWVEEGQAELVGDTYIGTVTHFSTWNVDSKFDPVNLCGDINIITRGNEVGLAYFEIKLSGQSFNSVGGWLCDDGSFNFRNVPSGESMAIEIIDYCGEVIHTEDVGPFSEDTKLETLVLSTEGLNEVFVQGNALTCTGEPVDNGEVTVRFDNRILTFPVAANGSFIFAVPICGNISANMTLLNLDDFSTSAPIQISSVNSTYNLGDVSLCNENEEYFYIEVIDSLSGPDPQTFLVTNPEDVWYNTENGDYTFEVLLTDPSGPEQTLVKFLYTQDLVLNQIVQGTMEDGLIVDNQTGIQDFISGEGYEFLFTEIGPLNQDAVSYTHLTLPTICSV